MFPRWRAESAVPESPIWTIAVDWADAEVLDRLLDLVEDEFERLWKQPDAFSARAAAILAGVRGIEESQPPATVVRHVHFVRFFVSAKAVSHSLMHGRSSLAFDWLLCALTERTFEAVEPGVAFEVDYHVARLWDFVTSHHPVLSGTALPVVLTWLGDLYYYSWKFAGLRELAAEVLPYARRIIATAITRGDDDVKVVALQAASNLASWTNQAGSAEAAAIARFLATLYEQRDIPAEGKKLIGMTLSTIIGAHTDRPPSEWAKRLLAEHGDLLVQYEPLHFLIASCTSPEEMEARYGDALAEVERFAREVDAQLKGDAAAMEFRRMQLFDVNAPLVRNLLGLGRCQMAIDLVAAWFGVPAERRRILPVLGAVPGHGDGVLYAVEGKATLIARDTDAALRRMTAAVNRAFDMNLIVRDDHSFGPHHRAGRWAQGEGHATELEEAVTEYFAVNELPAILRDAPVRPTGVFQPHAVHTPFQALTISRLGETWPFVSSFEQPAPDRPIHNVLIWTCGTPFSGHEAAAVEAFLRARGVTCETHAEEDLTAEQFLRFYTDGSFDVLWVGAHGLFDPREPHRALIELSTDKAHTITLAELLRHPVPGSGRRLLFLNICLGGTVFFSDAPPRLGLGAMLASGNQAVVAHAWEVFIFVAPLFGLLHAVGLGRSEGFFPAFQFAVRSLGEERESLFALLREQAPECRELIERLERNPFVVDRADIRTWGTPVFYE